MKTVTETGGKGINVAANDTDEPRPGVFLYARVSTPDQALRELSVPDQLALMRSHADARGWQVLAEYVDDGRTGTNDKRPQFQRMVDDAVSGKFPVEIILVHSFSRLFREAFLQELYRRQLEKSGVRFLSVSEDFGDGEGAIRMQKLVALFAEWQSAETGKHVRRTRLANAQQGYFNGGIPPLGYMSATIGMSGTRARKRLVPDPDRIDLIRLIFRLRTEGDGTSGPIGIVEIAEWLNTRGYRNRSGKIFHTNTIHRILTDEVYIGRYWTNRRIHGTAELKPKSEWLLIEVEPIISDELFAKTQAILASSRPYSTPPRFQRSNVLLGGLCRCGNCGQALIIQTGTSHTKVVYEYYGCISRSKNGRSSCSSPARIRRELLEETVLKALEEELLQPSRMSEIVTRVCELSEQSGETEAAALKQLKRNRGDLSGKLSRLISAVVDQTLAPSEHVRSLQEQLETELQRLDALIEVKIGIVQKRLKPLSVEQARAICDELRQKVRSAPIELKRRYLRAFIDFVEVSPAGVKLGGSCEVLAEMSNALHAANDIGAPEVQSSIRKWRE